MKSKLSLIILTTVLIFVVWSCKDVPPTGTGGVVFVVGSVVESTTDNPIANAAVYLSASNYSDSVYTKTDGKFQFDVDQSTLADLNATITVRKSGYVAKIMNVYLETDTTLSVRLTVDLSTSAVIVGTVRDSVTLYPLRNSTVHLTLPGFADSVITGVDGTFRLVTDLVDRESLPVLVTTLKSGYRTKQIGTTLLRGETTDLSNILLRVDAGSTSGQVAGRILDSKTNLPITNANVVLSAGGYSDSMMASINGDFTFTVDLQGLSSLTGLLRVSNSGYITRTYTVTLQAGRSLTADISLDRDTTASSALIIGTVRDSLTLYPLRTASVLVTLPGYVDSVLTPTDGSFRLTTDLVDRDSLPILLTAYKTGYKTKRMTITVYRGQTTNLGNILLAVDAGSTVGQVYGRIFDAQSRLPLNNATVTLISNILTDSLQSSIAGDYSFSINLQGLPSIPGLLKIVKLGYKPQTASFSVDAGRTFNQDFYLIRDTTTGIRDSSGTGLAHSIAFMNMTSREIAVYGVGGVESSILTWEVRDSLGFPIDIDHRDTVVFELIGAPVNGGAYVSPARAVTNASGRVATTVNSGTVSGVLQFAAYLQREEDGVIIRSSPVIITVNAGLPDQAHFTIAAQKINFPAYDWLGRVDPITVQAGDKYSNPVRLNTAVYLSTSGGIINASGFTNNNGQTMVDLHSGNPHPPDVIFGIPNMAKVSATTIGENGFTVTDTIYVLFSGYSMIDSISVDSFQVPSGGSSQIVWFKVSDRFGNPLSEGTHISATLQYTPPPNNTRINLVTNGDVDVTLGDTYSRGRGTTWFWFQVVDQTEGGFQSRIPATVAIRVTSPNGNPPLWTVPGTIGD